MDLNQKLKCLWDGGWSPGAIIIEALERPTEYVYISVTEEEINSAEPLYLEFMDNIASNPVRGWKVTYAQHYYLFEMIDAGMVSKDDFTESFVTPSHEVSMRGIRQCFERQIKIKIMRCVNSFVY